MDQRRAHCNVLHHVVKVKIGDHAPPDVTNWSSKHKRGKHTIGASEEFRRRPLPATTPQHHLNL
jgi:hypothetical protein